MGNILDAKPQTFSVNNESKIQDGWYLQTYKQRENTKEDPTDEIPWGNKSKMQIGAKILQDYPSPRLFVFNRGGKKVFLSDEKGNMLPNAGTLIRHDPNFGRGMALQILGPVTNPRYFIYTSDDQDTKDNYTAREINNLDDLKEWARQGEHGRNLDDARYAGWYGSAAINPMAKKDSDIYTTGARISKVLNKAAQNMIIPIVEQAVTEVVPGFMNFMQTTGLEDTLQDGMDSLVSNIHAMQQYQSSADGHELTLGNSLTDPRLPTYLQTLKEQSGLIAKNTGEQANRDILGMREDDPVDLIKKARAIKNNNSNMIVKKELSDLTDAIGFLKEKVGDNYDDWDTIDQLKYGLQAADTPLAKLNILDYFSDKLSNEVMPILDKVEAQKTKDQQSEGVSDQKTDDKQPDTDQKQPETDEKSPDTTVQKPSVTKPPVSVYHPAHHRKHARYVPDREDDPYASQSHPHVINGSFEHRDGKNTIEG